MQARIAMLNERYGVIIHVESDYVTYKDLEDLEAYLSENAANTVDTKADYIGAFTNFSFNCKDGTSESWSDGKVVFARYEFLIETLGLENEVTILGDLNVDGTHAELKNLFGINGDLNPGNQKLVCVLP